MAVRHLNKTEREGLEAALVSVDAVAAELAAVLPAMLAAAEKEAAIRGARRLPGLGAFGRAHLEATRTLYRLGLAQEDTAAVLEAGVVEQTL